MLEKIKNFITKKPIFTACIFIIVYVIVFKTKNEFIYLLSKDGIIETSTKYFVTSIFNLIFGFLSLWLISLLKIKDLAGINNRKIINWEFLLFPLYILLINFLETNSKTYFNITFLNWLVFLFWIFTIGFLEEIMFRGLLQSVIIQKLAKDKTTLILSVLIASLAFGIMHLVNFTNGFYGETSQFLYSVFFGVLFGALLVITRKIWPVIIIHMLINFFGVIEIFEQSEINLNYESVSYYSQKDFIFLVLTTLPCFVYGLYLLIKMDDKQVEDIIESTD